MNDSSKPVGIMPNHLDLREITFTNLLLLDFNPAEMESKYRVVFNRDMFALPNKKAMEVVMHFLFTRLHPQLAYEEFRDCWPVRDKVLEQQFRKVCFNWVSRIQKEDPEARLPRVVQSLFHSPGGDRFYSFLHHFSLYVLTKVMSRDHGKIISFPTFPTKTVHNHSFTHVMSKALEAHYIVLKKRFIEFTQHAVEVEHHWKEFAMESTKEFRSLVKKKRDLERQVMELDGMIAPRGSNIGIKTDYQEEVEALKRTQNLQKVRDLWAGIAEFHSVQGPQRRIVDSVLNGEANKYHIDASDIQPRVPDMLLRDCEREIRKRNIEDTYIGGKVNLFSLIQLWNLSLSKIKEQISQDPLPSFDDQCPTVRSALHTHHAHLTNTRSLRAAIEETMPAMKESIKEMKVQCYRTLEQKHSKPSEAPVLFNLGLVPPTPPVSFAAADTPAAERITSFQDSLKMSPDTVSTPDVIQAWTKSARRKQLHDKQESVTKLKNKKTEPSRLPRPKQHPPASQTINVMTITSKSTEKRKKKKPPTQIHAEKSISYPHYVTPRAMQVKNGAKDLPVNLRPQNLLADQIVDAIAMNETTSSSLSSSATSSRSSTPQPQALVDPVGALGQDAFQPRDRISRTPAKTDSGYKDTTDPTLTQPRTDTKPGRLLETILDESGGTATPSPAKENLPVDASPQAVTSLSWTDVKFPPSSLKTSLFHETPDHDTSAARPSTIDDYSDVKLTSSAAVNESFHHSIAHPTPKSVKKALFEESPQSQEMPFQQQRVTPRHQVTQQTPMSARVPLSIGPSPQLDFWLLPQDRNLDNSGVQATPMSARSALFEGTPAESGNSSFNGIEFLSRFGEQAAPKTDEVTSSVEITAQPDPFRLQLGDSPAGSAMQPSLLDNPSREPQAFTPELKLVDTREFAERLNRIKHSSLQRDTNGLQYNTSIGPLSAQHAPTGVARIEGAPSQLDSATRDIGFDLSGARATANSSQLSYTSPQYDTRSEQHETAPTSSNVHTSPKPPAFFKETSFQNVSSSSYEVDTSALIQRLNKIKLTQQSFTTPQYTSSRPLGSRAAESAPRIENVVQTPSDTSLLASRLDQIKQAQKSQQVTPGANTDGDLSTSRTSEPALLTPLTPSSRGTPSEDGVKNDFANFSFNSPQHVTSLPDSPSSPHGRSFFLQTPLKNNMEFTSPFQETPPTVSSESVLNGGGLELFEGLPWETATPKLPQRNTNRTGLASEEKIVTASAVINGLHTSVPYNISPPLLVNSVQRPDRSNRDSASKPTFSSVGGFSAQDVQDASPRLDLASPYQGNAPNHVTPSWQDFLHSPVIGQLIDFE
ncbi:hypothetical protein ACROYT_G001274 [Oculina patagonica]